MPAGPGQIIGSQVNPATGNVYMADVNSDGELVVSATVSVGSVSVDAGSEAFSYGKSGTGWFPLKTTGDGTLETTASVTVDSVFIASGANIGSVNVNNFADLGSNITGSVQVTNPAAIGSLAIQGVLGSVAVTSQVAWTGVGSIVDTGGGVISTNNSSASTLGANGSFFGVGDDVSKYSAVTCQLFSDEDSSTDGMTFQFSTDNTNWDEMHEFNLTSGTDTSSRTFQFPAHAQYFRVGYTNNTDAQGAFRLQTIYHPNNVLTSIHRLVDDVDNDRSATIVKSAIIAQKAGAGDFVPVQATTAGNLKVAIEEYDATAIGSVYIVNPAVVGSLATQGVVGSVQITNPAIVGSLTTQEVIGSVAVTNTVATDTFVVSGNAWTGTGSVHSVQGTDPWVTTGSTQITNPSVIGSLTTQEVIGSVAVTNTVATDVGSESYGHGKSGTDWFPVKVAADGTVATSASVTVDSVFIASGANIGSVNVNNFGDLGSNITGSVQITNPTAIGSDALAFGKSGTSWIPLLTETDGTLVTSATVTTGSEAFSFGKSGTSWFALNVDADGTLNTNATVTAGSEAYNFGKSGTDWFALRTLADGTLITSTSVDSVFIASGANIGSVHVNNFDDLGSNITGSVQITNPNIVGSLAIQTVLGSVAITSAVTGSESFAFGKSGTGWIPLLTETDGTLVTSATVTTGSDAFAFGKSGTDWFALSVDADGTLNTNATVNAGSESFNFVKSGTGWIEEPVVRVVSVSGIPSIVGSVNVDNFADLGSNITGSVQITNPNIVGSLAIQTVLGSVAITSEVTTGSDAFAFGKSGTGWFPLLTEGDGTLVTSATVTTGSDAFSFGKSGTDWFPLSVDADGTLNTNATVNAGSEAYNFGKSGTGWFALKTLTDGTLVTSTSVDSVFIASGANIGSVHINNFVDLGSDITGSVQITNPAVVGSLATQGVIGSVAITSEVTTGSDAFAFGKSGTSWFALNVDADGTLNTNATVTAGSESFLYGISGTDWGPLGTISGVNHILRVNSEQGTDPWIVLGSVNIDNAVVIGSYTTQTVDGTVSVDNFADLGSDITGSVQITNPNIVGSLATQGVIGSQAITNLVAVSGVTAVKPIIFTGSIPTTTGAGSHVESLFGVVDWIGIKGLNSGSTYFFRANDTDDYPLLSNLKHTGDWSFLTPVPVSGNIVFHVSGAQSDGDYDFRIAYK